MSDTLVLRTATVIDATAVAATIVAAFEQFRGKLVPESGALGETTDSVAKELAAGTVAIIAEQDGAIAGCVLCRPHDGDLYFGRLSVLPSTRGQGLAARLIRAVEDEARARHLPGVRLGVRIALTANQKLFNSLGYREIAREAHPGFDHPTEITMRKTLD
jgi:ribosomal protein S18 acetylase RimI-like enzyme